MGPSLSKKALRIQPSEIRTMSVECERVGGINLAQGICNTEVPLEVRQAVQLAIDGGVNCYTRMDGLAELRQAISRKIRDQNGIEADPETQVTVSVGATGAFHAACLALLDPGDEVILFQPYYGYHLNTLLAHDAVPTFVTLRPPDWTLDPEELERTVTKKTRGIVVCSPANPSGKVFSQEELGWIADLAISHDMVIFTDEIYEYFVFDSHRHISCASLPGLADRTVTISGFSKTFSITGWRIGYSVAPPLWAEKIGQLNDLLYVCAPAPLQYAVAVGLERLKPAFYQELSASFARKRDLICRALEKGGLPPFIPQGAYYVLADASSFPGTDSKAKAMQLLSRTGVASVPGGAFYRGEEGQSTLRFCFAKPDEELEEACRRLEHL